MSNYYNTSYIDGHKKIRGWKRRIKQLDKWGESIKEPYLNYFITNPEGYTYDRCILYPFYKLNRHHPPLWFYKLIIAKFIVAYFNWDKIFTALGTPYDLQLWLYDPAYIQSEIICYKMEQVGEVKRFVWESEIEKPFPFHKLAFKRYDLTEFDWILADDANIHFESDLDYADFTAEELLADGYVKKTQGDNGIYYAKRIGDIWIGRFKSSSKHNVINIIQPYFAPPV